MPVAAITGGYSHGPCALASGGVRFRLWAPSQPRIALVLEDEPPRDMRRGADGWHTLDVLDAADGTHYGFRLPDGRIVPDPASRRQPNNVHGMSEWLDTSRFEPGVAWQGRRWEELVLYELHVGAFTREGTFAAATARLDELARLGITALQVMPIADFPGLRNWGYDGVYPYAPDASYGTPWDFVRFIDAAHARGMAVLLDVVYNHFGPEGNYLPLYAPEYFTERHHTPWGAALNFDAASARPVRDFFVENALYWLREYRLDGLRLDAVHAIVDDSHTHVLHEIAARVRAGITERPVHLVLENEDNTASLLRRAADGRPQAFTAQWNDDIHHVLHVASSRESFAYYGEYLDDTKLTARALGEGFAFQGEVMRCRGRVRGEDSTKLPPAAFVSFIQNHDQIGNRAFGERLGMLTSAEKLRAVAAIYLLAPQIPMLFMGEEWNARQPFQFFCDFQGLADAVRRGRREEFRKFPQFADPAQRERIPDPQDPATFERSKLDWNDRELPEHAEWLCWYQQVIAVRRASVMPLIPDIRAAGATHAAGRNAVFVSWSAGIGRRLRLCANLSDDTHDFPLDRGLVIWHEGGAPAGTGLPPWTVRWTVLG